ncbi:MAG: hypothetical protein KJ018_13920 [Burkholderiales bacterium]|nr:hypothetical protein [Burkholderiales bacterium]GIK86247.1 MAG: hypothetical protein BroJett026_17280 [Betaproteobacteria bacterium]
MKHRDQAHAPGLRDEPLRLVRSARDGVWWERGDGLAVRLAAPERESGVDRGRLSLLGMLLAWAASGPTPR